MNKNAKKYINVKLKKSLYKLDKLYLIKGNAFNELMLGIFLDDWIPNKLNMFYSKYRVL